MPDDDDDNETRNEYDIAYSQLPPVLDRRRNCEQRHSLLKMEKDVSPRLKAKKCSVGKHILNENQTDLNEK